MAFGLDLGNLLVHLKMDASNYQRGMRSVTGLLRGSVNLINKHNAILTKYARRAAIAAAGIGTASVKAFASFDDAMIKSLAIMKGVTPAMRKKMTDLALNMSTTGVTSATDLAKGYFFLASAGFDAKQSIAALDAVNQFAIAGNFDMARATDLATDAQSALGLKSKNSVKNLRGLVQVTDVLVAANTLANATTEQFSQALTTQAGPAMKAYNISLEEGVSVLAAFADQGIKGQVAGSMLSRMIRLMTKGFLENRREWDRLNISIFDATGELQPMHQIVRDLTNAMGLMSTEQKKITLDMLGFQARTEQTILPLLGMAEAIETYGKELRKATGTTARVAAENMRSFAAQMKIFWNQIKRVAIAIGRTLAPELLKLTEWFNANQSTVEKWATRVTAQVIRAFKVVRAFATYMRTDFSGALELGLDLAWILIKGYVTLWVLAVEDAIDQIAKLLSKKLDLGRLDSFTDDLKDLPFKIENALRTGGQVVFGDFLPIADIESATPNADKRAGAIAKVAEKDGQAYVNALKKTLIEARSRISDESMAGGAATKFFDDFIKATDDMNASILAKDIDLFNRALEGSAKWLEETVAPAEELATTVNKIAAVVPLQMFTDDQREAQKDIKEMTRALEVEYKMLGLINDERERAEKLAEFESRLSEAYVAGSVEQINALTKYTEALDKLIEGRRGPTAFTVTLKTWANNVTNMWQNTADIAINALDGISSSLTDLLLEGKLTFNALAQSVLRDLTQMIIKAQLAKVMMSFMPGFESGGIFGSLFSGGIKTVPAGDAVGGMSAQGTMVAHAGGEVGKISATRIVPASTFLNAERYHNGLRDDEFAAIVQRGEVILNKRNVAQLKEEHTSVSMPMGPVPQMTINIKAWDSKSVQQMVNENPNMFATAQAGAIRNNHPLRRMQR